MLEIEEGLAAIHTALDLPIDELWFPAILYVTGIYYQLCDNDIVATARKLQQFHSATIRTFVID